MKYLITLGFKGLLKALVLCLLFIHAIPVSASANTTGSVSDTQVQSSDTPRFDRLKQQFENNRVFYAHFSHEYNDTFTGEQQLTTGTIWVGKERYKMLSGDNVMVVDDNISRVYDHSKNRVIISDYIEEEDDFAPSRMLQGVDDTFSVTESEQANGQTLIRLTSDDPFSIFIEVSILLDRDGIPVRIEAIDQVENQLITRFTHGLFIAEEAETFEFTYPDNAEQIDLRHDI